MARAMICDGEMWRCQSSATVSVENTTSERAASSFSTTSVRPKPGMRKNGASPPPSPSAALTLSMPVSISQRTFSSDMRSKRSG